MKAVDNSYNMNTGAVEDDTRRPLYLDQQATTPLVCYQQKYIYFIFTDGIKD